MTQAFNLSQFANYLQAGTGKLDISAGLTGTMPVSNGGTGVSNFPNPSGVTGQVLLASGTSAFGTVAPGTSGNVLTSNGSSWYSATSPVIASGGWTNPGAPGANVWVYNTSGKPTMYCITWCRTTYTRPYVIEQSGATIALFHLQNDNAGCASFIIAPGRAWYWSYDTGFAVPTVQSYAVST